MRQGLVALLTVLAAAGCGVFPHKAYDGPSRPERELSILRGGAFGDELNPLSRVELRVIDGRPQRAGLYLASVLPGRHTIGLSETLRIATRTRTQYCAVELDTLAGCLYIPRPPSPSSDAARNADWEWSVDMPIAAECETGGSFQTRVPARCGGSASIFERPAR